MKTKEEQKKAPKKSAPKKIEKKSVNDIIQKIVDTHATADQALAEMSFTCKHKDCEGK